MVQGEIYLTSFPFSDLTAVKTRPILVLNYNEDNEEVIVAAITSKKPNEESAIYITNDDLDTGEIKVNSYIRLTKIYTISQSLLLKKIAKAKDTLILEVKEKINKLLM